MIVMDGRCYLGFVSQHFGKCRTVSDDSGFIINRFDRICLVYYVDVAGRNAEVM